MQTDHHSEPIFLRGNGSSLNVLVSRKIFFGGEREYDGGYFWRTL